MSQYIEKIEKDYQDGNITLGEITKLRKDYNKLSAYDKGTLEIEAASKLKANLKNDKPQPKISNEEKVINLLEQQNSKLSTIKGILMFFLVLTILSFIASLILISENKL